MHTPENDKYKWWIFAAMLINVLLGNIDFTSINIALAPIGKDLNLTMPMMQWVINAYILTYASLIIIGGRLADSCGRLRVFLVGMSIYIMALAASAMSTHPLALVLSRVMLGLGAALSMSQTTPISYSIFPEHQRNMVLGLLNGVTGLGLTIGPIIGGFWLQVLNWHWMFLLNVPLALFSTLIVAIFAKRIKEQVAKTRIDYWGVVTLSLGIFGISFMVTQSKLWGWVSPMTLAILVISIIALASFYLIEKKQGQPIIAIAILHNKFVMLGAMVRMMIMYLFYVPFFIISLYAQNILKYSPVETGNLFLSMTVMICLLSPISGYLISKYGARSILLLSVLIFIPVYYLLSRINMATSLVQLSLLLALVGIAYGLFTPAILQIVIRAVDTSKLGVTSGIFYMSGLTGGALSIAIAGTMLDELGDSSLLKLAHTHGIALSSIQVDHIMQNLFDNDFLAKKTGLLTTSLLQQVGDLPQQAFIHAFSQIMLVGMGLACISLFVIYFNFKKN